MKSLNLLVLAGLMVSGSFLYSCSDDDNGSGGEDGYPSYVADGSEYNQWTYFDFATGTGRTEAVKSQSGAVEGIYYGDFSYSVMGSNGSQDSVQMIVSRISDDSVSISLSGILMSMGAKADTIELVAHAGVKKEGDSWVLSGVAGSVMNGTTEYHDIVFNGTIGTEKGSAVDLTLAFIPGAMPMTINGTYKGEVPDNKSWVSGIDETSFDWDIAFHKYDIRTNGGAAVKADRSALSAVTAIPTSGFEEDVEGRVMVDMSQMMQGFVGYQSCTVNKVLGSWVTATPTGSMPPYTYTLNNNVYIIKTKSGQYAKIKFYDMTNEKGKAVYAAFNYEFPMK